MAKTKEKDKKEVKPKLVEVYGDEVRESEPEEVKEEKEVEKLEKPEEKEEENTEERHSFKTEVVDVEVKEKKEERKDTSVSSAQEKPEEKSEDEVAFDEEIGSQKDAVRGVFSIGAIIFLVIFGLTGWAFYLKTVWLPSESVSEVVTEASPTPDLSPTPVPTPTSLEKKEVSLEILNGSGVTGLAGKTKTTFEELGYVVDSVGNADDTTGNELYVRQDVEENLTLLYEDVLEELEISSPSGYLDDDEEVEARIVLGS